MGKYILECCVDSVESAIEAQKGGANRLELCSNLVIGGTSPSLALFKSVKEKVNIKINVLLRPRFGDFLYTDNEFDIIREEIRMFKDAGADGVVIGCLKSDGSLDMDKMKVLVKEAKGMHITLHRAFDVMKNPYEGLEQVKKLGINTILTSGQKNSALEGKLLINELIDRASGDVEILVGSGVNANVIKSFIEDTQVTSFHMSGKVTLDSKMDYRKDNVSMGLPTMSEYEIWQTDSKQIKEAKDILEVYDY